MEIIDRGIAIKGEKGTDYQSCLFPGFCVLPSGRWLVSCRAAPARNNNWNQRVFLSYSDDEGKSWSEPFAPFQPAEVKGKIGVFRGRILHHWVVQKFSLLFTGLTTLIQIYLFSMKKLKEFWIV